MLRYADIVSSTGGHLVYDKGVQTNTGGFPGTGVGQTLQDIDGCSLCKLLHPQLALQNNTIYALIKMDCNSVPLKNEIKGFSDTSSRCIFMTASINHEEGTGRTFETAAYYSNCTHVVLSTTAT